jgi:hypothetical protein
MVLEPNGSVEKVHPASTKSPTTATDEKLQAYIHDEQHFSFVRYSPSPL